MIFVSERCKISTILTWLDGRRKVFHHINQLTDLSILVQFGLKLSDWYNLTQMTLNALTWTECMWVDYTQKILTFHLKIFNTYKAQHTSLIVAEFGLLNNVVLLSTACNLFVSCDTCVSSDVSFNCTWCERLGRCSDGVDRSRQRWQENNCGSSVSHWILAKSSCTPSCLQI